HVEFPEQLTAPRSERTWIHGADIGPGEQRQQAQALYGPHFPGHRADDFGIGKVSAAHRGGKFEMRGGQKFDNAPGAVANAGALQRRARDSDGYGNMRLIGSTFADVMEEKRH